MKGDFHVPFEERFRVKLPLPTQHKFRIPVGERRNTVYFRPTTSYLKVSIYLKIFPSATKKLTSAFFLLLVPSFRIEV